MGILVISEFRNMGGLISDPWGLILVPGGLVSDPRGLKPDPMDLKSDPGGLKSGRTENPILLALSAVQLRKGEGVSIYMWNSGIFWFLHSPNPN